MKRRAELARGAYRNLSVRRRCFLLGLNRSTVYYQAANRNINTVDHMNEIQEIYARYPFKGYKRITDDLNDHGYLINHKRVYRLMKLMGLQAVYPKKNYRCSEPLYNGLASKSIFGHGELPQCLGNGD